jgi:hypothetical protein
MPYGIIGGIIGSPPRLAAAFVAAARPPDVAADTPRLLPPPLAGLKPVDTGTPTCAPEPVPADNGENPGVVVPDVVTAGGVKLAVWVAAFEGEVPVRAVVPGWLLAVIVG